MIATNFDITLSLSRTKDVVDERRYTGDEIDEIFKTAASSSLPDRTTSSSGLTLGELTAIGRDVGIPPEQIEAAARRLEQRSSLAPRASILGLPLSVGRTVDLPRAPTDREWSILVGELRELFQAHGHENSTADTKSWHNGNLHAVIEPTEAGYRLRMGTRKRDATAGIGFGFIMLAVAIFFVFMYDGGSNEILTSLFFALMAAGTISYNALRLPRWASERDEQMAYFVERTLKLLNRPAELQTSPAQE